MERTDIEIALAWGFVYMILLLFWSLSKATTSTPNNFMGYRTSLSLKNKDTWKTAHDLLSKYTLHSALIIIPLILLSLLFEAYDFRMGTVFVGGAISIGYCVIRAEIKMTKTFYLSGKRKNNNIE